MDGDAISVDQLSQDFATFEAEFINQSTESSTQGRVPLHAPCQCERALVAHQGEQALGMKGCHQALGVTAIACCVSASDHCQSLFTLSHITLPAGRIKSA